MANCSFVHFPFYLTKDVCIDPNGKKKRNKKKERIIATLADILNITAVQINQGMRSHGTLVICNAVITHRRW